MAVHQEKADQAIRGVVLAVTNLDEAVNDSNLKPLIAAEFLELIRAMGLLQHIIIDLRNRWS